VTLAGARGRSTLAVAGVPEIPPPQLTPPLDAGLEHAQLGSWLDFYRATLIIKCAGLTIEQLVLRQVESSALTPLRIVRHVTRVEQCWFEETFTGREVAAHHS